ncbi:MAG: hypothetical protein IKY70_04760 [Bacteroidales bacterium]|nr:hypothetical protein [Bacteroidales bacterium]
MIACAIMVSCNDNGTSSDKIFTINVEEAVDGQCRSIDLSEYVSDLDCIALETDTIFLPNYKQFDLVPTKKGFVFTPKNGQKPSL